MPGLEPCYLSLTRVGDRGSLARASRFTRFAAPLQPEQSQRHPGRAGTRRFPGSSETSHNKPGYECRDHHDQKRFCELKA